MQCKSKMKETIMGMLYVVSKLAIEDETRISTNNGTDAVTS